MKKILATGSIIFLLVACGGNEKAKEENAAKEETVVKDEITKNPDYSKGLALIAKTDCLTCHKINEVSTGPAYADVAARYSNAADTTITRLAQTIIKGGKGNWGAVPMTPHPALSEEDAKQMVKYVLLLKK